MTPCGIIRSYTYKYFSINVRWLRSILLIINDRPYTVETATNPKDDDFRKNYELICVSLKVKSEPGVVDVKRALSGGVAFSVLVCLLNLRARLRLHCAAAAVSMKEMF